MVGAEVLATLPGAFNACISILQLVQIGRSMGNDYTRYLFRIEAAGLRLSRWGESLQLNTDEAVDRLLQNYPTEAEHAVERLREIWDQIGDVQKLSLKDRRKLSRESSDLTTWDPSQDTHKSRSGMWSICEQMKRMTLGRRKGNLAEQVKWALYKKATFDLLVTNMEDSIEELIELFPGQHFRQQSDALVRQEAETLSQIQEATPDDFNQVAQELRERDLGLSLALKDASAQQSGLKRRRPSTTSTSTWTL